MIAHVRPAVVLLLAMTLLTGLAYPLSLTAIGQLLLPHQANGSMIVKDGRVIGSSLIGQSFESDRYFHGRPSAAGDKGYDAASSSGSNLGPLSKKLIDRVAGDIRAAGLAGVPSIPADAVTTSASGLDPHISPSYADLQVARVAMSRGLPEASVSKIVREVGQGADFGLGEPRVNVLLLNMALDAAASGRP